MNVVEMLTAIREKAGDEVYEKIKPDLNKLASGLREAEVKLSTKEVEYNSLFGEMKRAKEKESATKQELEKAQKEVEKLKSDSSVETLTKELDTVKAERDGLKTTVDESNKRRRQRFVESFETYREHADFKIVQGKMKLPDDGEKIDWEKIPDDDVFANLTVISEAEGYGLFKDRKKSPPTSKADEKTPKAPVGKGLFPKMSKRS